MPFYEYECQACKFYAEVMQKISDAPLIKCPSCGKRRLKKLVSAPVFRLKGGGWYETDFKSDKENKRNLVAAEKEEPKTETKAEGKGEAKEAKTETKDAKESKPAESKSAAPEAAESRPRRVSLAGKRSRVARKPARSGRSRGARRTRR